MSKAIYMRWVCQYRETDEIFSIKGLELFEGNVYDGFLSMKEKGR